jgi:hypothetical protein
MNKTDALAIALLVCVIIAFYAGYLLGQLSGWSAAKWDEFNKPPYSKR